MIQQDGMVGSMRLLLVEDSDGDAFLMQFYLEEVDKDFYQIDRVVSLGEAMDNLAGNEYDAVLLDLNLPDSSDLDTVRRFREEHPDDMVIVLTGQSDGAIGLQAVKMGAEDFLTKGNFDAPMLDSAIRFAHERYSLRRRLVDREAEFARCRRQFKDAVDTMSAIVFERTESDDGLHVLHPVPDDHPLASASTGDDMARATNKGAEVRDLLNAGEGQICFAWADGGAEHRLTVRRVDRENEQVVMGVLLPC